MKYDHDCLEDAKRFAQEVSAQSNDFQVKKLANAVFRLCQGIENKTALDDKERMHDQKKAVARVKKAATAKMLKELKGKKKKR